MPWLWLALLLVSGPLVDAHGFIEEPKARNWLAAQSGQFYDAQSLNHNKLPFRAGICGGQFEGDTRFSVKPPGSTSNADGQFAKGVIVAQYTQGQAIKVVVTQTAAHYGRFEFRLCPLSSASMQAEYNELSDACFDANPLFLAPESLQPGLSNPSGAPERYHYFTPAEVNSKQKNYSVVLTAAGCHVCTLRTAVTLGHWQFLLRSWWHPAVHQLFNA